MLRPNWGLPPLLFFFSSSSSVFFFKKDGTSWRERMGNPAVLAVPEAEAKMAAAVLLHREATRACDTDGDFERGLAITMYDPFLSLFLFFLVKFCFFWGGRGGIRLCPVLQGHGCRVSGTDVNRSRSLHASSGPG